MVLAGQDAWRRHPLLFENWRKPFPGLKTAVAIFSVYLVVDYFANRKAPKVYKTVKYAEVGIGELPTLIEEKKRKSHHHH